MTPRWDKTLMGEKRLLIKDGFYKDRRVIGKDTPIDKGVYLGEGAREAIVVDLKNSQPIKDLYVEGVKRVRNRIRTIDKLEALYQVVREAFPILKSHQVDDVLKELDVKKDVKVDLSEFIKRGIGSCRHMALSVGVLLETFINDGLLEGKVSIDRNKVPGEGSHAWCRYEDKNGKVYVIDVAKQYVGTLGAGLWNWPYNRPEDK